ncbi:hypothetical protein COC60_27100 [Bacillus thuringiensis]|nr:putative membrane protein [Bacillus cereus ATCC 10876]MBG9858132.1 hypothetical protein [Bacillus wiedmannii]PFQ80653.1 hypothetical protein COK26_15805 [Bacillus thuringiensis]SUY93871.1 Uncharacterised protein [Bacillus cereus]PGK57778.1 hypothetical protein CN928_32015 [Bacillus thuringiensis]
MENINLLAMFYLTNFTLFLLGVYGTKFFEWVHKKLSTCKATTFGIVCTMVCVLFVIHLMWVYK